MTSVILIDMLPDHDSAGKRVPFNLGIPEQALRLLARTDFDDEVAAIYVQPTEDLDDMVELIVMATAACSQPNKRLMILHELPEAYWRMLQIQLLRRVGQVEIVAIELSPLNDILRF